MCGVLAAIALTPVGAGPGARARRCGRRRGRRRSATPRWRPRPALPDRWIAIGVGPADAVIGPDIRGHLRRLRRRRAGGAVRRRAPTRSAALPLCALIAGWLRGQANPRPAREVRVYAADLDADAALARGRALRAEIDATADPVGVLVVADGANTLTPPAPGGYDPDADAGAGRPRRRAGRRRRRRADRGCPTAIVGRVAYQVLAGLAGPGAARGHASWPRRALRRRVLRRHLGAVTASDDSRPDRVIGPTGTGKSQLALEVAERLGGEIVNADAMQLYRGMDIGTAKLPRRRAARHPAPPTRRPRRHRDRDRRALPAGRRRRRRGDRGARRGAGHRRRLDAVHPVAARRLGLPGHRPGGAGPLGGAARRGRRGRPARRTGPASTRPPRRRSCPPTAAGSCARWRWSS